MNEPETALYRCDVCGVVVRYVPGRTALGHVHYDDAGNYLGKDGEGHAVEFADDGREGVADLREGRWYA